MFATILFETRKYGPGNALVCKGTQLVYAPVHRVNWYAILKDVKTVCVRSVQDYHKFRHIVPDVRVRLYTYPNLSRSPRCKLHKTCGISRMVNFYNRIANIIRIDRIQMKKCTNVFIMEPSTEYLVLKKKKISETSTCAR